MLRFSVKVEVLQHFVQRYFFENCDFFSTVRKPGESTLKCDTDHLLLIRICVT